MIFLISRNFLEFLLTLFSSIFYFKIIQKNKKGLLLPRADMAERSHVVTRGRAAHGHVCLTCVRNVCAWHACVHDTCARLLISG